MKQLADLTAFLISLNLVAVENIDSYIDDPKIIPSGKLTSDDSIILYRLDYTATINIEAYPHKRHAPELLFGHLCAWLMDNDAERDEIATPNVDVDILDNETADIEISIDFEEDVHAIEDITGEISLNGKQYKILASDLYYAKSGDLSA